MRPLSEDEVQLVTGGRFGGVGKVAKQFGKFVFNRMTNPKNMKPRTHASGPVANRPASAPVAHQP